MEARPESPRAGLAAALGAFLIWGLSPLFWARLRSVDSFEVLAHRILWSSVLAGLVLAFTREGFAPLGRLRDPRVAGVMLLSTALIAVNWFVFIWAVQHDRVTEVSIGYYTNPLYNVLLGRVVLQEKIGGRRALAVLLAGIGVAVLAASLDTIPWVSLSLALSFGTYGLVRKLAPMAALPGLMIETTLWAPFCLAYLVLGIDPAGGAALQRPATLPLLIAGGAVTASPLLLFAVGARRLPYSTLGMLQYLAPTLQLGLAVFVFGETFTPTHALTFGCIWAAVALYATGGPGRRTP